MDLVLSKCIKHKRIILYEILSQKLATRILLGESWDMEKKSKNSRILDMYVRLCEGKIINRREEAERFGVDERSIQRDIDDIRAFLAEKMNNSAVERSISYSRKKAGYVLEGSEDSLMSNDEILAVSKILLESRAFTQKEMNKILDKLIAGCVPRRNMKLVMDLITNEKFHYVELHHKSNVKDKLWKFGEEIQKCSLIELTYEKQIPVKETVKRVVRPVGIVFSEYYFYLNAYIVERNECGKYEQKYDYPAIFRVDRITEYKSMDEKISLTYASRFEEGEFRKRVQFMFPGELIRIQFKYTGKSIEAILDRLPTAQIVTKEEDYCVIGAEVYGKGVLMWLLSQGASVEVLRPQSVREEMKNMLLKMLENYQK